jgi:hypothetical protein
MEPDDLDLHFYPVLGVSDEERDEWRRIVLAALPDAEGAVTVVFVREPGGWVLEGFLWAAPGGGFARLPEAGYQPLRNRVVTALRAAGKPVRVP